MGTSLSTDEVCRILEAGAKSGVRELNYSGLHVVYGQPAVPETLSPMAPGSAPLPVDLTETQHNTLAKASLEKEELQTREDQLAELLVTDPLRYEEMLQNGDLTDDERHDGEPLDNGDGE